MQRVADGIIGHDLMLDVDLHDLPNFRNNRKPIDILYQCKRLLCYRVISSLQFVDDSLAGHDVVARPVFVPPLSGPSASGYHIGLRADFVVEAGNGRFDVDTCV